MKLLFLLLLCVLILARSARSRSFDVRLHGLSIPTATVFERGLFIKRFCRRKYLRLWRSVAKSPGPPTKGLSYSLSWTLTQLKCKGHHEKL